jgi:hypothetical protein
MLLPSVAQLLAISYQPSAIARMELPFIIQGTVYNRGASRFLTAITVLPPGLTPET